MKKVGVQKAKIRAALWLRLFIFSVLGSVVFSLQAETLTLEQQKAEFIRLVQSGQLEQAYQLAAALEAQLAGEPDFDMAYGRIALQVFQQRVCGCVVFACVEQHSILLEWCVQVLRHNPCRALGDATVE